MGDDAASKEVGASAALNNHGGVRDDNILLQLNDNPDADEIEVVHVSHSPYPCPSSLPSKWRNTATSFGISSLIAQSLLTKYSSFRYYSKY